MKIAILGTGPVGQTLADALTNLGHEVSVGTRDPHATLARTDPDTFGNPPFQVWSQAHPHVALATYADAAQGAELVVNATNGSGSLEALKSAGAQHLAGKVLLDVANPLDFSAGMPPSLFISNSDSLGEQIQRAFPDVRVVKALNTMNAYLMVDPGQLAEGQHSVFVSGDDATAKGTVTSLLTSLGHRDVIDLGDITTARGTEMYLPLWARLWSALGTPMFNIQIVR